ncbi:hypothetical protein [Streptococcus sp. CSL10205-OR2]|uniref:hypothetical protein n=1 Tax=Streptococcus sp. CSL10205-OR2 TaxID=2980558 RepID=UPI0021D7E90A|nr:hypothetical protein [Streptococcus sp. CSL10205-OR2]MCU9534106.1 hypothetical protein [Streptococcus sp. CSL10205-OR2]
MIYLIKPVWYQSQLITIIQNYLKEKHPNKKLIIKRNYTHQPLNETNTYIVINDPKLITWDGLEISKNIRLYEPQALLILASTEIDHNKFFKSHVGFFGIIDIKNLSKKAIQNDIEDSIKLLDNQSNV